MMESNLVYQWFKQFEKEHITEAKYEEHWNRWLKLRILKMSDWLYWLLENRELKTSDVMAEPEEREAIIKKVLGKLISVDKILWRFSRYDFFESLMVEIFDLLEERLSIETREEYEDRIQLEKQARKVRPEFTKPFKKYMLQRYEHQKSNAEDDLNAYMGEDLQEFREWLQKEREKECVTPYHGKGIESMKIFRNLIGELGELLNPHFRGNPGVTTPHLVWPCAKAIAELLNSYFVNLKVNFNADQVRKRFDSYIYIEKN